MMSESLDQQLARGIKFGHPCLRVVTSEEDEAVRAAVSAAIASGRSLTGWSAVRGVHDALLSGGQAVPQTENPAAGLVRLAQHSQPSALLTLDLVPHLREDSRFLRALRELISRCVATGSTLVMIDHDPDPPPVIRAQSILIEAAPPTREEIEQVLRTTLKSISRDVRIEADLTRAELSTILKNLQGLTTRQIARVIRDVTLDDNRLDIDDLNHILAAKRKIIQSDGVLEFVESPSSLDTIGGLHRLKKWLNQRKQSLRDDAQDHGLTPPRGVLILGVQGSGKSLCAKAIGTAWERPILRLDAGALYDRYVGESERRLREALRHAELMAPVVLWIDEIEKAFASAASTSTDGGLSRRMFGALLTWMQERTAPVFLAATANDIEALPPELLRKGRFDEIFFVDLPTPEARRSILSIHLRKRKQDPAKLDLDQLVTSSAGFSGAEIEQAIVSALATAFAEGKPLETAGVREALETSPPLSVTMREKIDDLRSWAMGPPPRCVPAD
jgi:ATP-dependent 26S proteasome regulatory subunit